MRVLHRIRPQLGLRSLGAPPLVWRQSSSCNGTTVIFLIHMSIDRAQSCYYRYGYNIHLLLYLPVINHIKLSCPPAIMSPPWRARSGGTSPTSWSPSSLTFRTSTGRYGGGYHVKGGAAETRFSIPAVNGCIVGFWGRSGWLAPPRHRRLHQAHSRHARE
jgi:hypothetical protein